MSPLYPTYLIQTDFFHYSLEMNFSSFFAPALLGQILFAQEANPSTGTGNTGGGMDMLFLLLPLVLVFFWFFVMRPQQRQEERQRKMIDSLDRNDRVYTVGGMIGVIYSIDKEKNEVVLKVDDSQGTKIKFLISAIAAKIPKDSEKSDASEK